MSLSQQNLHKNVFPCCSVSEKPKVSLHARVQSGVCIKKGEEIRIDAYISGSPYPKVTWLRNSEDVTKEPAKKIIPVLKKKRKTKVWDLRVLNGFTCFCLDFKELMTLSSLPSGSWTRGGVCDSTTWAFGSGSDQERSDGVDDPWCLQGRSRGLYHPGGEHSRCCCCLLLRQRSWWARKFQSWYLNLQITWPHRGLQLRVQTLSIIELS